MAIFNTLILSSAVALSLLAQGATPVNALATPGAHGIHARHGVTPNHNGMLKHKRNAHKLRKRCIAQQSTTTNANTTDTTDNTGGSSVDNNNYSYSVDNVTPSTSAAASSYTPPATTSNAPACSSGGKVGLAWAYDLASNYIPNAITGRTCYLYNWSSWAPDSSLLGSLQFVPMFWGGDHIDDFTTNVINSGTNYGIALGMNE
jgi:hypothetical protein